MGILCVGSDGQSCDDIPYQQPIIIIPGIRNILVVYYLFTCLQTLIKCMSVMQQSAFNANFWEFIGNKSLSLTFIAKLFFFKILTLWNVDLYEKIPLMILTSLVMRQITNIY